MNYIDAGAVNAGRDVSIAAISAVSNSSAQLNETFKTFALQTEAATDSALKVASNVTNANSGGVNGINSDNAKTIAYTLVALAVVAAIAKKAA